MTDTYYFVLPCHRELILVTFAGFWGAPPVETHCFRCNRTFMCHINGAVVPK